LQKKYAHLLLFAFLSAGLLAQPSAGHNLVFDHLPGRWDEGLPLGNGLLGSLVWEKEGRLRLALDRADLWDCRPMKGLVRPEFSYQWVAAQVAKGEYGIVQEYFDHPYDREAGPTKLPGGALEFENLGRPSRAELSIANGLATLQWADGQRFETFIHAQKNEGWFRATGFPDLGGLLKLLPPAYRPPENTDSELARLGYPQSEVLRRGNVLLFHQSGWGGFSYEVAVAFKKTRTGAWEGVWSVSSHFPQKIWVERAEKTVRRALARGFDRSLAASTKWWSGYWSKSSVSLPDPAIESQYYRDLYKFGCAARENGPMISLQAVWTADNGRLPPWKSDFHHDLNTQLSYWPAYTSNHLAEGLSFLRHLESNDAAHRNYTRQFFGTSGLAVPGVSTLLGEPMGGWIQYACSPTASAWLAQHFYLHWRYSQDRAWLRDHAWPWLSGVATHLAELSFLDKNGVRVLPLSSSPEIHDNSINAWFSNTWTNYDLALTRFVFEKTAELADEMHLPTEAEKWRRLSGELPELKVEPSGELMFAPGEPYRESHRHFSHAMAIHPLGLLDFEEENDRRTIVASLAQIEAIGPAAWCGYSYAWLASLRARARNGAGARDALRIFAEAFVSKNSFHLNGDQSGKGYSGFTYDPFTLEGNFTFAAGVQEMLLQSHHGVVRVFPAVPGDWERLSFKQLRAEGAFLVSAERGRSVEVFAEKGGALNLELPAGAWVLLSKNGAKAGGIWKLNLKKGERAVWISTH
jgi:hypothetical protein